MQQWSKLVGTGLVVVLLAGCGSMRTSIEGMKKSRQEKRVKEEDLAKREEAVKEAERLKQEEQRVIREEVARARVLEVSSEPSLARVYVNERYAGLTPCEVPVRFNMQSSEPPYSADLFSVTVRKEGYEPVTRQVNFADFQPSADKGVFTSLDRKGIALFLIPVAGEAAKVEEEKPIVMGLVSFKSTPDGAEIYLDNGFIGATPKLKIRVPEGNHQVKLTAPGCRDWERNLKVLPDTETVVEAKLEKR